MSISEGSIGEYAIGEGAAPATGGPLGFLNNPDCACCDGGCSVCDESTLSVTLGGFSDGACSNCDEDLNATFVCDYSPGVQECRWVYEETAFCTAGISDRDLEIEVLIYFDGADWILQVKATTTVAVTIHTFQKNCGATPPDCTATHTLTLSSKQEPAGATCVESGTATCQLN